MDVTYMLLRVTWERMLRTRGYRGIRRGVDGVSSESFNASSRTFLKDAATALDQGTYAFNPRLRKTIPKRYSTGNRIVQRSCVIDKVVARYLAKRLRPFLRPFLTAKPPLAAVKEAKAWAIGGFDFVRRFDFTDFFDTIDPAVLLLDLWKAHVPSKILQAVESYLYAPVERSDGVFETPPSGIPQGGELSPLLADFFTHRLHAALSRMSDVRFALYVDDGLIAATSAEALHEAESLLEEVARKELGLSFNEKKNFRGRFTDPEGIPFLGYLISRDSFRVDPSRVRRFRRRLCSAVRESGSDIASAVRKVNSCATAVMRISYAKYGWIPYYFMADDMRPFQDIDRSVRRSIRAHCSRRWSNRRLEEMGLKSIYRLIQRTKRMERRRPCH